MWRDAEQPEYNGRYDPVRLGRRLLVVDNYEIFRTGMRTVLQAQSWVDVCAGAASVSRLRATIWSLKPHVILLDSFLGGLSGIEVCSAIRTEHPLVKVVITAWPNQISTMTVRRAGASGIVAKHWPAKKIVSAVKRVAAGETAWPPAGEIPPLAHLTDRETQILRMVSRGLSNLEMSRQLGISPDTVKQHASAIYRKLDVRNRAEAVGRATKMGIELSA